MSNLKVVSDNIGQTATLTASTEAGSLVVENLQLDSKAQVWRSTSTTAGVTAIFTQQNVSCVSFPICNFTSTATMRVRVYTLSGDGSPALDTTATLCCEYTTIDKIDFGDGALNANTFSYGGGTYATLFFASTLGEKVVVDIVDTSNTNGYVEACALVIGDEWSPTITANYGVSLALNESSKHSRNDSGDLMTNRGARHRALSFNMGAMDTSDRTEFIDILIRNGMSVNLFLSIFPGSTDTQQEQMYQIYGRLTKVNAVSRFMWGLDKSKVDIQEI